MYRNKSRLILEWLWNEIIIPNIQPPTLYTDEGKEKKNVQSPQFWTAVQPVDCRYSSLFTLATSWSNKSVLTQFAKPADTHKGSGYVLLYFFNFYFFGLCVPSTLQRRTQFPAAGVHITSPFVFKMLAKLRKPKWTNSGQGRQLTPFGKKHIPISPYRPSEES
jgi:hypothetical protein